MKFRFIKKRCDFGSFLSVCLIITIITVSKALYCLLNILFVISLYYFLEMAMVPPLQYSCLENPMDGGAWWAAVHGVPKSRTRLSDFTFTFHFHAFEKAMAAHSSVLAWRIPGTGEPGGLPSMGSQRVGHDWSDFAAAAAPILVLLATNKKASPL